MAPLQRLTFVPIDDPAEQAALDEKIRLYEEAMAEARKPKGRSPKRRRTGAAGEVLDLPS
jgi:hypothetical protein